MKLIMDILSAVSHYYPHASNNIISVFETFRTK